MLIFQRVLNISIYLQTTKFFKRRLFNWGSTSCFLLLRYFIGVVSPGVPIRCSVESSSLTSYALFISCVLSLVG